GEGLVEAPAVLVASAFRHRLSYPAGMAIDPDRRADLLGAKLRVLVAGRWGDGERRTGAFPGGATVQEDGRGWVLVAEEPARVLGRALLWAAKNGVGELHVLVDDHAGIAAALARRATQLRHPPDVWEVTGRDVHAAVPTAPPAPAALIPEVAAYADALRAAGAEPVVEAGVLRGEVLGLEVARVMVDSVGV